MLLPSAAEAGAWLHMLGYRSMAGRQCLRSLASEWTPRNLEHDRAQSEPGLRGRCSRPRHPCKRLSWQDWKPKEALRCLLLECHRLGYLQIWDNRIPPVDQVNLHPYEMHTCECTSLAVPRVRRCVFSFCKYSRLICSSRNTKKK